MRGRFTFETSAFIVVLIACWVIGPSADVMSQTPLGTVRKLDSLKAILTGKSGLMECDILYQLAYEYFKVDNPIALDYSKKALESAWKIGDSLRIVKAGRVKAMILNEVIEVDSAIAVSHQILLIATRNGYVKDMEKILNDLAVGYTFKAKYDRALIYNFESLTLREAHGDKISISIALNNIGLVYYKMKNYEKALSYFEQALELKTLDGKKVPGIMHESYRGLLLNISLCYSHLGNTSRAKSYVDMVLTSCDHECSDRTLMLARYCLGLIFLKQGDLTKATTQFLSSLSLAKNMGDERYRLDNLIYLAQISLERNQLVLAEKYLEEAETTMENGLPYNLELMKVYSELSQLFKKSKDYYKVAYYQDKFIQFKDTIYNEELTTNLMRVEAEHLERENKAKIDSQAKILALNDEIIFKQRALNIIIGIVSILLVILTFFLIRNLKRRRIVNDLLEQGVRQRTLELETNHNMLLKSLEERDLQFQRISSDVKSSLATIKGLCRLGLSDAEVTNTFEYMEKIDQTSDSLLVGLHRTIMQG